MCDPGEKISTTLKREFMEEATDCLGANEGARAEIEQHLKEFFSKGEEVYTRQMILPFTNKYSETIISCRFTKDTLMTQETLTMHGWKRSLIIFMMKMIKSLKISN